MKTLRTVEVTPIYVDRVPPVDQMEEGKIYISKLYSTAIHLCLCGCKMETVTTLGDNGWTLTEQEGKISLSPSIGNYNFRCQSHYIITSNKANFL